MNEYPTLRKRTRPVKVTNTVEKVKHSRKSQTKKTQSTKKQGESLPLKKKPKKAKLQDASHDLPTYPYPPLSHEHQQMPPPAIRESNPFIQAEFIDSEYLLPGLADLTEANNVELLSNMVEEIEVPYMEEEMEVEYLEMKIDPADIELGEWSEEVPDQILAAEEIKSEEPKPDWVEDNANFEETMSSKAFKEMREKRLAKKQKEANAVCEVSQKSWSEEAKEEPPSEPNRPPTRFIQRDVGREPVKKSKPVTKPSPSDRLPYLREWRALVTTPPRVVTPPGYIPTQFLTATGDYLAEFRRLPCPKEGNTIRTRISTKDGAKVTVETIHTGEIFIRRFGQRAQIRSAYAYKRDPHNTADQRFFPKLVELKGPEQALQQPKVQKQPCNKKKIKNPHNPEKGIKTEDIPLRCPYWAKLLDGLKYPPFGFTRFPTNSCYDGVRCLVMLHADGQVVVKRNGFRFELLPPIVSN